MPRPKPGPPSSEELVYRQLRLRRMILLLCQGKSYRAIAKDLGLARSTVMRMAPEAAAFSAFADFVDMTPPMSLADIHRTAR